MYASLGVSRCAQADTFPEAYSLCKMQGCILLRCRSMSCIGFEVPWLQHILAFSVAMNIGRKGAAEELATRMFAKF